MQKVLYRECREKAGTRKNAETDGSYILFLRPSQIQVSHLCAKKASRNALIRLSESIKRYGLLEPLPVHEIRGSDGTVFYELLGNEQYWQAACLAGMDRIPCTVPPISAQNSEKEAIFEQIRQKTLHIFEQAAAFQILIEEYGLTQGEVARRVGVSQSAIANKLRLLQFSKEERQRLLQYGLSERHARALLRIKSPEMRAKAIEAVHNGHLTVAEAEEWIESILVKEPENKETSVQALTEITLPAVTEIRPRKFAMQSLQPLYNSIDKTLSIFRKTGRSAEMERQEGTDGVKITIHIPK